MAEIASTTFSQTDASNTGALPGLSGTSPPSQIDNSIRALMGATKREHDWRNYSVTSTGSANAYVLTYSVAPDAYYTGQRFAFKTNFAVTGAATVNVNSLGAKTIKKIVSGASTDLSSGDIASGDYIDLVYDGTNFVWVNKGTATPVSNASDSVAGIVELSTTAEVLTGTATDRAVTPDALAALWEQGSDIASAGTISVGEGGYFNVTGTTTITDVDFATDKAGRAAVLKFAGALTLTHNATTLILPTGANITTAAGDTACFISEGSDNVRCVWYSRASGAPLASSGGITYLGAISTASGSSASLGSLNLTGYKFIRLVFKSFSSDTGTYVLLGNSTSDDVQFTTSISASAQYRGYSEIDLSDGVGWTFMETIGLPVTYAFDSALSTSSTNVSVAMNIGNFDGGSIAVYGFS
jgi:hypothetical protein